MPSSCTRTEPILLCRRSNSSLGRGAVAQRRNDRYDSPLYNVCARNITYSCRESSHERLIATFGPVITTGTPQMFTLWDVRVDGGKGKELYGEDYADIYAINRLHYKAASPQDCDHVSNIFPGSARASYLLARCPLSSRSTCTQGSVHRCERGTLFDGVTPPITPTFYFQPLFAPEAHRSSLRFIPACPSHVPKIGRR